MLGRAGKKRKNEFSNGKRPPGLKPNLVMNDLRGAEAPLFHGSAGICEFFPQPV
jgi:hypothetical protein